MGRGELLRKLNFTFGSLHAVDRFSNIVRGRVSSFMNTHTIRYTHKIIQPGLERFFTGKRIYPMRRMSKHKRRVRSVARSRRGGEGFRCSIPPPLCFYCTYLLCIYIETHKLSFLKISSNRGQDRSHEIKTILLLFSTRNFM